MIPVKKFVFDGLPPNQQFANDDKLNGLFVKNPRFKQMLLFIPQQKNLNIVVFVQFLPGKY